MAEYSSQDAICPFYKDETKDTIHCEGLVSCACVHDFSNKQEKQQYKEKYCNTFNYKNCLYAAGLLDMYKPRKKETAGTFSEDTLLAYRQE